MRLDLIWVTGIILHVFFFAKNYIRFNVPGQKLVAHSSTPCILMYNFDSWYANISIHIECAAS